MTSPSLPWRFQRLLVEEAAREDDITRRVQSRLPQLPVEIIHETGDLHRRRNHSRADLGQAKRTLLLAHQKGPFWRPCPGTKGYLCCGYQVLQVATGCPMDCSYCILQGYLNFPAITIFTNVYDLLTELQTRLTASPSQIWRLGTGEFADSLALDDLMGLNHELIQFFARQSHAVLEIKSKCTLIEPLLPLGPNPQVIFAWSLNPPRIIRQEEHFTAPLEARLRSAQRAAAAGFRLAFHFDPLIYYPGWENDYRQTVERLFQVVPPEAIAWISLGALRFMPRLKAIIRSRFPASRIAEEEFITALDGKLRYFKSLRIEMYARMRDWIVTQAPEVLVYLCMESPSIWQAVFGFVPAGGELPRLLDRAVEKG
ncbi:MAG: hypothetical protein BZ151_00045 [Desulfobacca sp. 4484_104]|nr:MAG: hypothetical protein BZ151_00045 [Desulfobacca sp. 4484_104]